MRVLKKLLFTLIVMLSVSNLYADNLKQSFDKNFGPTWTSSTLATTEGWSYTYLARTTLASEIFDGEACVYLQTQSGSPAVLGTLSSPEKTDGVGLVTFWSKMRYTVKVDGLTDVELNVLTSEDGTSFTKAGTVLIPAADNAEYKRYSVMVDKPNAKYVKFELPNASSYSTASSSLSVLLDEIIITDNPGAELSLTGTLTGEIGGTFPNTLHLQGTNVTSDVTLTIVGEEFSLTSESLTLTPTQLNAGYDLTVNFAPSSANKATGRLIAEGDNFPGLIMQISGSGSYRNIAEGFNESTLSTSYGNHAYVGWSMKQGKKASSDQYKLDGAGALHFYDELISPNKVGGIGEVSFWYRSETPKGVAFSISHSEDGETWTSIETIITKSIEYVNYHHVMNNANAKYIKVALSNNDGSEILIVDNFVITENTKTIAQAIARKNNLEFASLPITKQIPITFSNITSPVTITTNQSAFTLSNTTLTAAEANGVYDLEVTFNPTDTETNFVNGNITISGGGLNFDMVIPVNFYREQSSRFSDFDAAWGSTSMGNHYTDQGWQVFNGYRSTYNLAFDGVANVYMTSNSTLISPPMKDGIGSIQFYSRLASATSTANLKVSVSDDGLTWTEEEVILLNKDTYQAYDVVINSSTAKYVRLDVEKLTDFAPTLYIENFTITKNGAALSKINMTEPFFASAKGVAKVVNVEFTGENITSDLTVSLKSEDDNFATSVTTIPAADINGKTYSLPITFTPGEEVFHQNAVLISGDDFSFTQAYDIKGYQLKDILYEDFEKTFTAVPGVASTHMVNGWKMFACSRLTYGIYDGLGSLQLSASNTNPNPYLLSPPKSNGVGTIQFYYKNNASGVTPTLEVRIYKSLDEAPTRIETINPVYSASEYSLFNKVINDPDAQYVELYLKKPTEVYSVFVYVDNVTITANGKSIPMVVVPENVSLSTYKGESVSKEIEVELQAVEGDVTLSMKKGTNFEVDVTKIEPVGEITKKTINVSYTPTGTEAYSSDVLMIEGDGLLKPVEVAMEGLVLQHTLNQGFDSEWGKTTAGNYSVEGWKVVLGARTTSGQYGISGGAGVQLKLSLTEAGSLTSPEKIPGIDSIKMDYHVSNMTIVLCVETSEDGTTWDKIKEITHTATGKYTIAEEIKNKEARYLRVRGETTATYPVYLTVDKIEVTGMPYLHQVGSLDEDIETTEPTLEIPVLLKGILAENVKVAMSGGAESNFALSHTQLTPEQISEDTAFTLTLTFSAEESGTYNDAVFITAEGDEDDYYLIIPVQVTYNKPYVILLNEVEPIYTNIVPVSIPVSLGGNLFGDVTVELEGTGADAFTMSSTTLTKDQINEGVDLSASFTASASGVYEADIVIRDTDIDYLTIPLKVTYVKPYVELANPMSPVQVDKAPLVIPIEVKGLLLENATISLQGSDVSYFQLSSETITPADLEESYTFNLVFNSMEARNYSVDVLVGTDNETYTTIPVTVIFKSAYTNGETIISSCDFETNESFMDWKTYDLDGKALAMYFDQPKPWFWTYELQTEVPESNSVMAASSIFASNMYEITPADDWFFSMPLQIAETGSFGAAWESRSLVSLGLETAETYEVRVINDQTLTDIETELDSRAATLEEALELFLERSDLIFTVYGENPAWTERKLNLDAYKGQTVRVVFRHISADQHTLYLDNFKFYSEAFGTYIASSPEIIYTQVPEFAMKNHSPALEVVVNNGSSAPLSNVKVKIDINDEDGKPVYTESEDIASFAANSPKTIQTKNNYVPLAGWHSYTVSVDNEDYSAVLNTVQLAGFDITTDTYALDNGDVAGGVYSESVGFKVGQKFPIEVDSYLQTVSFALTSSSTATTTNMSLYEITGKTFTLLHTAKNIALSPGQEKVYQARFDSQVKLEAGKIYFVAFDQKEGEGLYLGRTSNEIGSIAAYYTTANAEWDWLLSDYTLYIRIQATESPVAIDDVADGSSVKVFFDNNDLLHIRNAAQGQVFSVYDMQGRLVYQATVNSSDDTFALSVANGVYVVRIDNKTYKINK